MVNRDKLAKIAKKEALKPFHGFVMTLKPNFKPIINLFPKWPIRKWDKKWCAAFVYYCCINAGYKIPVKFPHVKVKHNFAGVLSWEQWAKLKQNQFFYKYQDSSFVPARGDLIIFNRVFQPVAHDHIGIIIKNKGNSYIVAEGNVNNISTVIQRPINSHIRGFIRIPDNYNWEEFEKNSSHQIKKSMRKF